MIYNLNEWQQSYKCTWIKRYHLTRVGRNNPLYTCINKSFLTDNLLFHSDGFGHTYWMIQLVWDSQFLFLGVTGWNFLIMVYLVVARIVKCSKRCRPKWNATNPSYGFNFIFCMFSLSKNYHAIFFKGRIRICFSRIDSL